MQPLIQEELVKLQAKGLITIPKKFREELGLEENSLIRIKKDKDKLTIEPVRTLPYRVRSYTNEEIEEFFKLDDEETKELKRKKLI